LSKTKVPFYFNLAGSRNQSIRLLNFNPGDIRIVRIARLELTHNVARGRMMTMKAASIKELKQALVRLEQGEMLDACLRLARFKKENKELLTYLLFGSQNETAYIGSVCAEVDELFSSINKSSLYFAKKGVRKTIRWMEKHIRYSGIKETEIEIRLHFCKRLKKSGIRYTKSKVMTNMYLSQLKKIETAMAKLHQDIQHEYRVELEKLG